MSVYIATDRAAGVAKIGYSKNPMRRIGGLRTATPSAILLESIIPGDHRAERQLHSHFDEYLVCREWFRLTPAIEKLIAAFPVGKRSGTPRNPDNLIETTRKAMGLSQAELAAALGVTQSTVSRLETGELEANERTKLALEALLARHKAT